MHAITRTAPLAGQCYTTIEDLIVNGTLAPGQKLKIDVLSKQLDVGHSPIREALSRLAASGLVEAHDNKGFRVASISEADVRDTYRTFFQIEALALKQAIELGDDAWEASIVAALHHISIIENKKEAVPYNVWAERNYAFHVALIAGCASPLLLQLRAEVYRRFDRYCRISFHLMHTELEVNHDEHKKLAECVIARDYQQALALMKHHIFGALEDVIAVLKANNMV